MKTKLIISGLAFLAISTVAGAQNRGAQNCQRNCSGKAIAYVDTNKNGICDKVETSISKASQDKRRAKENYTAIGQGQRGMQRGQGRRINFTDADKNGICDFYETRAKK